jgi:MFS family permease
VSAPTARTTLEEHGVVRESGPRIRTTAIRILVAGFAIAVLSVLVAAPAPAYDPWAWLLWGREIAHGTLSTAEGPAFKPLPVAVTTLLSVLGGLAPEAWVVVARLGTVLAIVLAFRAGRRLAGASLVAGVAAAAGVALCGALLRHSATGAEPGWVIALALAGAEAWRAGRPRAALACGVGCALLRVEAWPFLLAFGLLVWRRRPQDRPLLAACAAAIPALWFVPEWIGSGDVLRSGARARVPNPGQPALADVPAWASLREALALPLWPLWLGAVACAVWARAARPLLLAGLAWIALVAAMAQAGFSGEPRYALPGAALVAVAGAAGLARAPAVLAVPLAVLVAVAAVPRLAGLPDVRREQAYQRELAQDLATAIREAGGRAALLACGRPYVGALRGPLLAYHLDVEKRRVGFEPRPPGTEFRSRRLAGSPVEPPPAFSPLVGTALWEVRSTCSS